MSKGIVTKSSINGRVRALTQKAYELLPPTYDIKTNSLKKRQGLEVVGPIGTKVSRSASKIAEETTVKNLAEATKKANALEDKNKALQAELARLKQEAQEKKTAKRTSTKDKKITEK